MTHYVGIGISADSIRAVGVRRGEIVWALESDKDPESDGGALLRDLLARAPFPRWKRTRVRVSVGPSHSQVKRLVALPPITSPRAVRQLIEEGVGRFFLRNGTPLLVAGVRIVKPGEVWAAALDREIVDDVTATCREIGLRLDAIAPAAAALVHALNEDEITWRDGSFCLEVGLAGGTIATVRRFLANGEPALAPRAPIPGALNALGEDGWRYADAYGAAVLPSGEPLALRPGRSHGTSARVPAWRIGSAGAVFSLALVAALLLPAFSARRAGLEAGSRVAAIDEERRVAVEMEGELARVTGALDEISSFAANRRSATLLLAELARALPDSSALLTLRIDSVGGTLVALTPRTDRLLAALERSRTLTAFEVVGPVTRELAGGRELERLTLRFRIGYGTRAGEPSTQNAVVPSTIDAVIPSEARDLQFRRSWRLQIPHSLALLRDDTGRNARFPNHPDRP